MSAELACKRCKQVYVDAVKLDCGHQLCFPCFLSKYLCRKEDIAAHFCTKAKHQKLVTPTSNPTPTAIDQMEVDINCDDCGKFHARPFAMKPDPHDEKCVRSDQVLRAKVEEYKRKQKSRNCITCEKKQAATRVCYHCSRQGNTYYCAEHDESIHKQLPLQDHIRTDLNKDKEDDLYLASVQRIMCDEKEHSKDREAEAFCLDFQVPICLQCLLAGGAHNGHKHKLLSEMLLKEFVEQLQEKLRTVGERIEENKLVNKEATQQIASVKECHRAGDVCIRDQFTQLKRAIEERQRQVQSLWTAAAGAVLRHLEVQEQRSAQNVHRLSKLKQECEDVMERHAEFKSCSAVAVEVAATSIVDASTTTITVTSTSSTATATATTTTTAVSTTAAATSAPTVTGSAAATSSEQISSTQTPAAVVPAVVSTSSSSTDSKATRSSSSSYSLPAAAATVVKAVQLTLLRQLDCLLNQTEDPIRVCPRSLSLELNELKTLTEKLGIMGGVRVKLAPHGMYDH